jgi:methylphosphotriester-DNA--protein-cysteine methyltransferase
MHAHSDLTSMEFSRLARNKEITIAGNSALMIYGTLRCQSGRRMKSSKRVFFANEKEAKALGYRPCGHCLRKDFLKWKTEPTWPGV